jgi:hypothetical protein
MAGSTGTFDFFSDSGLTTPILTSALKVVDLNYDGSSGNVDTAIYFGSPTTGRTLQAASSPGVDQIVATVTDSAVGTGQPDTLFKVALTQLGLDTADQTVDAGATLLGGAANAVTIWVRANITQGSPVVGAFEDLAVYLNEVAETG